MVKQAVLTLLSLIPHLQSGTLPTLWDLARTWSSGQEGCLSLPPYPKTSLKEERTER